MKIAVFCGSRSGNSPAYEKCAEKLGKWIGENGHTLVYGASNVGLMKTLCDSTMAAGGDVIGVEPGNEWIRSRLHTGVSNVIYTDSMAERKQKMMELSDAFIALPGGLGTLDELGDVICLLSIGEINKPLVLFNTKNYYAPLVNVIEKMCDEGFAERSALDKMLVSDDILEIGRYLNEN